MSKHFISRLLLAGLLISAVSIADTPIDWNKPGWQLSQTEQNKRLEVLAAMSEMELGAFRNQRHAMRQALSKDEKRVLRE